MSWDRVELWWVISHLNLANVFSKKRFLQKILIQPLWRINHFWLVLCNYAVGYPFQPGDNLYMIIFNLYKRSNSSNNFQNYSLHWHLLLLLIHFSICRHSGRPKDGSPWIKAFETFRPARICPRKTKPTLTVLTTGHNWSSSVWRNHFISVNKFYFTQHGITSVMFSIYL